MDENTTQAAYDPRQDGMGLVGGVEARRLTPNKPGAMVMQLEEQNMLTNQLNERLEMLFERLRPVWQSPNQKSGETEADRAELPPQIEQIAAHNRRIRHAVQAVNLMLEGLEV